MILFHLIFISIFTYCYALGTTCSTVTECSGEEQCISGSCQCGTGQISYNGRCVTNSGICTGNQQVYFNGKCLFTKQINEQCETSNQCLGGSACFNGICVCPTGTINMNGMCTQQNSRCANNQIYINNQCYNLATVGQQCQIESQCLGGATCLNGQCQCPSGTTLVGTICQTSALSCPNEQVLVNGVCTERVAPGQRCQSSMQCFDGAECASDIHLCVCPVGMYLLSGYCRKMSSDDPCDQVTSIYYNNNCFNVQRPGANCQVSYQCLGGSECISGYCQCPTGSVLVNSYCVTTVTTCNTDQVMVNNRCYNMVAVGQLCYVSEQCRGNAECNYSAVCSCPTGMQEIDGYCRSDQSSQCLDSQILIYGACYDRVTPSSTCIHSEQCLDGSSCTNNICTCPANTRMVQNYCVSTYVGNCALTQVYADRQCLDLRKPGYSCTSNLQCMGSSTCPSGICICSTGYKEVKGYCISQNTPSQCPNSQVYINGQCYNYALINQYCVYEQQCQGGAKCQNNFCKCETGYSWQNNMCTYVGQNCEANQVYVNGNCYNTVNIGQNCQFSQQCLGGSECANKYCRCPVDSYQSGNYCISNGGAICSSNQVNINGVCYNYALTGQACQFAQQCQGGSTCTNGYCQCPLGTYQQGTICLPSTGSSGCVSNQVYVNGMCYSYASIGQSCQVAQQCQGGSTCTNGYCQCPLGTYQQGTICISNSGSSGCPSNQVYVNGICYNYVAIGQSCQVAQQCQGGSTCTNGYCQCPLGTYQQGTICIFSSGSNGCASNQVYVNGMCYNYASISQSCQVREQCQGGSTCMNGYCQCPLGTYQSSSTCVSSSRAVCNSNQVNVNGICYNYVAIGQSCQVAQQCQGGSTCINGNCQCPSGSYQQKDSCIFTTNNCNSSQVHVNGKCYSYVMVGQSCQVTQQCQGGSSCVNGNCQCPHGTILNNNVCINNGDALCSVNQVYVNGQCLNLVKIGEFCIYNDQCLGLSNCTMNLCTCPAGTSASNGFCEPLGNDSSYDSTSNCQTYQVIVNRQCLDRVTIGMACSNDQQCIESSSCIQADSNNAQWTCQCNSEMVYNGTACISFPGETCPYNTVFISFNNCLPLVSLGQECTQTSQCMGFGECQSSICQCPTGQTNINEVCRQQQ